MPHYANREPSDVGDSSESYHLILESQQLTSAPVIREILGWLIETRKGKEIAWDPGREAAFSHVLHQWLCVLGTVLLMQYDITYHKCGIWLCVLDTVMFKILICMKALQYRRPLLAYLSRQKLHEWSPFTFGSLWQLWA